MREQASPMDAENVNRHSVLRHIAKRVRAVEDALPTSCVAESMELTQIADDIETVAEWNRPPNAMTAKRSKD